MKLINYYLLLLLVIATGANAQQSLMSLPRDARNNPLSAGLGGSYATSMSITTTTYDVSERYQVPSAGLDVNRAYRHFYILNRDNTETVTACFGDAVGCTTDSAVVRPGYGLIFEPVLFGAAVGKEYIYFKIDGAGSASIDVSVW